MIVNSHNIEFGYELLSAVPYSYEKYLNGELTETISGIGSEPLYYFSPKHTINKQPRSWYNTDKARLDGLPYTFIHKPERPKLAFPPYKEHYANKEYKWEKPTLCICNRYNREWGCDPINYFNESILNWLFENLKSQYEIIYFAVDLPEELQDNEHHIELNDREICKKHGIKIFQDIKKESWNESMLKLFANCEHYITMNGGYSIMASLFGGTNIIYTRRGVKHTKELDCNSFYRWYPNHSNQRTLVCEDHEKLKEKVKAIYIDKLPTVNIIMRTSNRPNAFRVACLSVENQDYPNINLIVTTDGQKGKEYSRQVKARHIEMTPVVSKKQPDGEEYGKYFPANEYIDRVQKLVNGYIIFLDDDDMFTCKDAVSQIVSNAEKNSLLVWKTKFNDGRIIPNGSFGKEIKLFDITGVGLCYHSDHIDKTDWSQWKRADYRTAKKLSLSLQVKWLDKVLTMLQGHPGMGAKNDVYNFTYLIDKGMKTIRMKDNGKVVRLPKKVTADLVNSGDAEYLKDVVETLNSPTKPVVTENKMIESAPENKKVEQTSKENAKGTRGRKKGSINRK